MEGEAYVRGYFPGIPQFGVSSYRIGDNRWHDTVSAYVMFGLHSLDDSEWKRWTLFFSGEPPERFTIRILVERWELIVDAPHWFLVLFCASLAAIPWTPAVFRIRRFSLRTLLIVTTLLAIALAMLVYVSK